MTMASIPPIDEDLVFICGALRSGTTLLRLMVNGHGALDNPGEMDFLFEAPPLKDGAHDMAAFAKDLSLNRVFQSQGLIFTDGLGYQDQVRDFIRQLRKPGQRLSINVHRHFDRIPAIFPNARYAHLLRDPRDAAKSALGMGWAGNVYHGVDHWINSERDFERLEAQVSPERIHVMKNEDLLRAPERELTRLCEFFGVAYDPAMLDYPSNSTYGPPDPELSEQWRRSFSERELSLVEGKASAMMKARGYELSGAPLHVPGRLEREFIRADNRWKRLQFGLRRHGPALVALEFIVRRAPIPLLTGYVRRKRAENDAKHLK